MIIVFLILCTDAITKVKNLVEKRTLGIPGGSSRKLEIARIDPFLVACTQLQSTLSTCPSVSWTTFIYFSGVHGQILHYCSYPNVLLAGHTTIPCHVGQLVHPLVHLLVHLFVSLSVNFLNRELFLHCCSCPTICDWISVYPASFLLPPHMRLR